VVRVCLDHTAYQHSLREEVASLPAEIRDRLHLWAKELNFCWHADLDPLLPLLCSRYSTQGRPARDPAAMLRCLLLMTICGCKRPTEWFQRLRKEPILTLAAGFAPDDPPRVASFYDFLGRLYPAPRRRYALRRPAARRLRPKDGKKLPPSRRGLLRRMVDHLIHATGTQRMPDQLWNELLGQVVAGSVERGLIPGAHALCGAADGTPLESGCYSHGLKSCECLKTRACDHPRRFTDPGALNGYDSYRHRWFVGRHLQTLVEANSGYGLPLWLNLEPANCHDAVSGAIVLHRACQHYAHSSITLRYGLFDKAYEGEPFLRLCYHHHIDPVVARTRPAKIKTKIARRLAQAGVHLSPQGVPVCQAGLPMRSRGHSKPHVWAWTCPRAGQCDLPCPFATRSLCLNALNDPRALTPAPSATPARKSLFKRRTAIERWHAWLDSTEVHNARHRRDYLWFGRCALAAIAWHLKHWATAPANNGLPASLLATT
jgi:hypothetical protein